MRVVHCAAAVVFVCASSTVTSAAPGAKQIVIRWSGNVDMTTLNDSINRLHVTADDSVSLRVTHLNFLHYSLKFTVEERQIDSYVLLDKLWSDIFKAVPGGLRLESGNRFEDAVVAWRRSLANSDAALGAFRTRFAGHSALSDAERQAIVDATSAIGAEPREIVEALRRTALDAAATSADFDLYERVLAQHDAVVARLDAFLKAADLINHGEIYNIGKKKAGTVVTFTITAVDARSQAAGAPLQTSYFVKSTRPLILHVGFAMAGLKNLQFEKVRSLSGSDLFLSTKSDQRTDSLVTFLSYEFWTYGPMAEGGLQATLGTSFQKPGESIFVAGGFRLTRFVVSVGLLGTGVLEGGNKTVETIAGAVGQRDLYTTIAIRQHWGPFTAISIRVF